MGRKVKRIKDLKVGKKYKQVVLAFEEENPIITIINITGNSIVHQHDDKNGDNSVSFKPDRFEYIEPETLKELLG